MAEIRLTASEFRKLKRGELEYLSLKVISSCEEKVGETLLNEPFNFNPRFINEAVQDIVHKGKRIFDNAEQDCTDAEVKRSIASDLYETAAVCRRPKSEAFLVLTKKVSEGNKEPLVAKDVDAVPFTTSESSQGSAGILPLHSSETLASLYPGVVLSHEHILRDKLEVEDFQSSCVTDDLKTFFTTKAVFCKRAAVVVLDIGGDDVREMESKILDCFKDSRQYSVLPLILDIVEYHRERHEVCVTTFTTKEYSKARYTVTLKNDERDSHVDLGELEEVKEASGRGFFEQHLKLQQQAEAANCLFSSPAYDTLLPGYDVIGSLEAESPGYDCVDAV